MKLFKVPITHEYIQNLTEFDLEFIDWSTALDDPKVYEKVKNTVYDDEFDEYVNETEEDDLTDEERKMMEQIINQTTSEKKPTEDPNDWENIE